MSKICSTVFLHISTQIMFATFRENQIKTVGRVATHPAIQTDTPVICYYKLHF